MDWKQNPVTNLVMAELAVQEALLVDQLTQASPQMQSEIEYANFYRGRLSAIRDLLNLEFEGE